MPLPRLAAQHGSPLFEDVWQSPLLEAEVELEGIVCINLRRWLALIVLQELVGSETAEHELVILVPI